MIDHTSYLLRLSYAHAHSGPLCACVSKKPMNLVTG